MYLYCSNISRFVDSRTKRKLAARVALQLLVQPGSYKLSSPSCHLPQSSTGYSGSDMDVIEWSTKEQGSTHVSALLVRLDGFFS